MLGGTFRFLCKQTFGGGGTEAGGRHPKEEGGSGRGGGGGALTGTSAAHEPFGDLLCHVLLFLRGGARLVCLTSRKGARKKNLSF